MASPETLPSTEILFRLGVYSDRPTPFVDEASRHGVRVFPTASSVKSSDLIAPDGTRAAFFEGGWLEITNLVDGSGKDLELDVGRHLLLTFWFKSAGTGRSDNTRMHALGFGGNGSNLDIDFGDPGKTSATTGPSSCWTYLNSGGKPALIDWNPDRAPSFYFDDQWHFYALERNRDFVTVRVDGKLLDTLRIEETFGSAEARNFIGRESDSTAHVAGLVDLESTAAYPWVGYIAGFRVTAINGSAAPDPVRLSQGVGRCGTPDPGDLQQLSIATVGQEVFQWNHGNLSVSLDAAGCNLSANDTIADIQRAFGDWENACPFFSFTYPTDGTPCDITVFFSAGGLGDITANFGVASGGLNTVAATEQPSHRICFDSTDTWSNSAGTPAGVSLFATALHEIGHVLGLEHEDDPTSIMHPSSTVYVIDAVSRERLNFKYGWGESRRLSKTATTDRPALGCIGSASDGASRVMHMLWKGTVGDSRIFESRFVGGDWTDPELVPGIASTVGPALTEVEVPSDPNRIGLFMAWRGPGADEQLYYATRYTDVGGWSSQSKIDLATSSCRPSLQNYGGVRVAWKAAGGDQRIWWSTLRTNGAWDTPKIVPDAATNDSPQLASFQNKLYLFWRDAADSRVRYTWLATTDAPDWETPSQRANTVQTIGATAMGGAVATKHQYILSGSAIATTQRGPRLLLTWRQQGSVWLYFTDFDGAAFSGTARLHDFQSEMEANLYTLNGVTHMVCRGRDADRNIFWSDL